MRKIFLVIFTLSMGLICGCAPNDPQEEEIKKAQALDLLEIRGEVVSKSFAFYVGESDPEVKDKPYYVLGVYISNYEGGSKTFTYRGVSKATYDSVEVGTDLPLEDWINAKSISRIEGEIVDLQCDLETNKFWVIIRDKQSGNIKIFRSSPEFYYDKLQKGMRLPISE